MLTIAFANPQDTLALAVFVDGKPVPVTRAYNSRALVEARCFLGFFSDLSALIEYDTTQSVALYVDKQMGEGEFLGLFMDNVAHEFTLARAV